MKSLTLGVIAIAAGALTAQAQVRTETTTTKTTWNGVLVDAACQNTVTERKETTTDPLRQTKTTVTQTVDCPVTAATNSFGLMTSDGRFIRFDNPSNTRVLEIVRGNNAFADRDPVKVTVIGSANGDVAVVESVNPQGATTVQTTTTTETPAEKTFDVTQGGDRGKLLVTANGLNYQNLEDADESRAWTYAQIKELKRNGAEIEIKPYDGDSVELRVDGGLTEALYQTIANRVVAARTR